jgi:hypothetical protein
LTLLDSALELTGFPTLDAVPGLACPAVESMSFLLAKLRTTRKVSVVARAIPVLDLVHDLQVAERRGRVMLMRLLRKIELLMIDILLDR